MVLLIIIYGGSTEPTDHIPKCKFIECGGDYVVPKGYYLT